MKKEMRLIQANTQANKTDEEAKKEKTMKISIKEGCYASAMSGLGDSYIIPNALALNASNLQIGLLKSFSSLLPPLSQLYGSKLMEKNSRKKILFQYVSLQALMWLPILLISLLFWKNLFSSYLPYFLVLFYTLYAVFGSIAAPAWFSLIGEIVPEEIRGKYFGKRSMITGTVALIAALGGAFILDYFKTNGILLIGFSILFFLAFIARSISAFYFKKHYDSGFKFEKKNYFSFKEFLSGWKKYNFTKFAFFVAIMNFSVMIAGPFFSVYMLSELKFNYVTFMIVNTASSLFSLIMLPVWGKFSDRYGRREVLILCSVLISIIPAIWFLSSSPYYLIFPMILAGIGWSGFDLSAFNFIYDSVSKEKRSLCLSYFNILVGIGVFLGSLLGGLLLDNIVPALNLGKNTFLIVFLVSSLFRAMTAIFFISKFKEIRKVKKFHPIISLQRLKISHGIRHEFHVFESAVKNKAGKILSFS